MSSKEDSKKTNVYKIICIILLIILIVVLFLWGRSQYVEYHAESLYDRMAERVNQTSSESEDISDSQETESPETEEPDILQALGIEVPEKNIDWDYLHSENKDIYAWIYIPNTKVDYPVLQSGDDNSYYLEHNLDGSRGKPGCIYSENYNHTGFTDYNTVLYGHNMKSGAMFGSLHKFEDSNFFEKNQYVYIYTESGVKVYEIFAAYNDSDAHILNAYDFSSEENYGKYLDHVFSNRDMSSNFRDGVSVTSANNILTLSTCTSYSDQRYIVQAVLINQ